MTENGKRQWGDPEPNVILDPVITGEAKEVRTASMLLLFDNKGEAVKRACIVVGSLAIHDDIEEPEYFCISHVPTRTSFMKAVPTSEDVSYDEDRLAKWCKTVQERHHWHWQQLNSLTPDNYKSRLIMLETTLMTIREWCLSVEL